MTLSVFPHFREIDLSCKDIVSDFLSRFPLEASEYTFVNMFAFRAAYNFKICLLNDNLIILKDMAPVSVFCPVGSSQIPDVIDEIMGYMKHVNNEPYLERVPERFVTAYCMGSDKFTAEEEREHFDYVYDVRELIELKGHKFHDKKNQVNKFRKHNEYTYEPLTTNLIDECIEFEHYWCEVRECGKYPGLNKERCAILEMLNNFDSLEIKGGIIRVENKIAALALGERMLPDTLVIHVEKANSDIPGLYQVINQEFLIHEAGDCRYVNREQDLGVQGLRTAKLSYNPVHFIKKFKVRKVHK